MARPLRIEYAGALYHVTARENERRRIYFTKTDYGKFREYIEGAKEKYGCLLHVYPNVAKVEDDARRSRLSGRCDIIGFPEG